MTRRRLFDQPGEFPVLDLVLPMPLDLAADVMHAVGKGLERSGYRVFMKEADGMGRIWVSLDPPPDAS